MNQIVESFIDKDERLKSMYESTSIESKRQAISEGTKRIDNAVEKGVGADYNSLQTVFKEILNQDLSSNASSLVDTQLTQGKNLDSNVRNFVSQGQNNISNTNVNNSINQNPANTYQSQIDNAKTNSIQNMDNYKENTSLNNQEKIDKGNEILKEHKDDNDKSSRSGKALESVISGVPDMKKGYENLADLTKWETPGSDGKQELKNSEKNWDENLNKLFNKEISPQVTQGKNLDTTLQNGVNQGQNNISNTNVNNSINQNPANTYQSQIDNAKTDFSDDIKGIPQSLVFKSQHNPQIAEVKEQLSYLKDDIENLNMSNIQPIIDNKKGKK